MKLRILSWILVGAVAVSGALVPAEAASQDDDSLGTKIKKLFATPTPTPHRKKSTSAKSSPSPSAKPKTSPKASPSTTSKEEETPTPKAKAKTKATPEAEETPTRHGKAKAVASPEAEATPVKHSKKGGASPEADETPVKHSKRGGASPEPGAAKSSTSKKKKPTPEETPSPTAREKKEEETPSPSPDESSATHGLRAAVATITTSQIVGYDNYPAEVKKLLEVAINLTTQNLEYKYGSADPSNGGMDCSGFVHYVLSQQGLKDVPRDAREQYIWVRKAGTFQAVIGHDEDTFELDALKPGDLLFWTGTYKVEREPNITHTMIYVGREKGSNQRIMVGSSDGRTYKGQSRFGVSIFDFKVARSSRKPDDGSPGPSFVGYGRVPNLPQ